MPRSSATDKVEQYGFSLRSVCWGYREIFADAIKDLLDAGAIGAGREAVTRDFYAMLKGADKCCFDHVVKEFLAALNPQTRWLLDLPGVFAEVTDLGRRFAESKLYHGSTFFRVMGEGGLGPTPTAVRYLVSACHRLFEVDEDIAAAFVRGYHKLQPRLTSAEIDQFINLGNTILQRSRDAAISYYAAESKAAENTIVALSRECRLADIRERLQAILQALTGRDVEVGDLGSLDSDDLLEHGAAFVCMYQWCYVPARIRAFEAVEANRDWFQLLAVVAAGMLAERSLPYVQGQPGCRHIEDLAGPDLRRQNLVTLIEYVRVLNRIRRRWPGAARLLDFGLRIEAERQAAGLEALLFHLVRPGSDHTALRRLAAAAVNVFDTIQLVTEDVCSLYPEMGSRPLSCYSFLPDFRYASEVSSPPSSQLVADLKTEADNARRQRETEDEDDADGASSPMALDRQGDGDDETEEGADAIDAAFVYDEWCQSENDYLENYCKLHEVVPEVRPDQTVPPDVSDAARRVRRVFESLKPEIARKEKYLDEGDEINTDLLYDYIIDQQREPSPKVRFYEKPLIQERDLAVLILLDTSGSTSQVHGDSKVLELEKQAATILAEGLHGLGDRFELGGFSSNGADNCRYLLFKTVDEDWSDRIAQRLQSTHPANSTRMGVALRHAGWRLSRIEARQRLIILITDGKPMDSKYSPDTRYAQFDVRMACEENERQQIATFAISTEENSLADMEIMFPQHRFAILNDMQQLPRVLPKLYIRLTV